MILLGVLNLTDNYVLLAKYCWLIGLLTLLSGIRKGHIKIVEF